MGLSNLAETPQAAGPASTAVRKSLLIWLTVFAVAMAYLEAALVVYLRELLYPDNIQQMFPLKLMTPALQAIELGREAATLFMLLSMAMLTRTKTVGRFAVFVYLFGMWDVFYYVWLRVTISWPTSWLEWDVLFLIPWMWLGPWVCPALIATLFATWGANVLTSTSTPHFGRGRAASLLVGVLLCLTSFLQPAFVVLQETGIQGLEGFVPDGFWWLAYVAGVVLMAIGLPWTRHASDKADLQPQG